MTFNASKSLAHLKICSCGAKWDPVVVHGQFHPTQGPYSPIFSCAPLATTFNSSFFSLLTCPAICMPRRCKSTVADCYETTEIGTWRVSSRMQHTIDLGMIKQPALSDSGRDQLQLQHLDCCAGRPERSPWGSRQGQSRTIINKLGCDQEVAL